ncbi:unnamed protein product [Schistosoma rodhaini]|nr:unnamed protein product [Schistosoma rodhaini]
MDALYPNFYSLTSVTSEPLDPRVRRRSLIWCGNNTTMPSTTTTITTTTSINNINTTNNDTTIITSSNNNSSINDSNTSSNVLLPKKFDDCPEKIPLTKNTGLLIRRRSLSHNPLNRNLSLCNPNHQIYMKPNLINSPTLPSPPPLFADKNLSTVYSTLPQTSSSPPLFAGKNLSTEQSTLPQTSGISSMLLNNPYSIGPLMDNSMKHQMKDGLKMSTITSNTLSPTRNRKLFDHPLHDQMIKGRSDISRGGDYLLNQPYKHPIHDQFGNNQHYYHRNTYSTLAYPINSNARIQSAVSLQSLDQLKSINVPDRTIQSNYSIENNLITNECSSLKMKKNNNSLQYCCYQVPGNDLQYHRQHQQHQHQHSSPVQRSDSFTRTSSSTTGLPMNKTNSLFLGKESFNDIISPIQLNSFHPNRIRPIERRRYTQYGISYHHHNNNELDNDTFRLKHQQQQQYTTLPQVLPRSSPLSKINSNVQDDNKIEQNGMDMDRNRDIPILSNIRRQKPVNSRRAHVVSAFEQSLNNMSQRLQNLSNTTTRKDSELHELRATIDALRNQTELGFFKKPPINQPCELNRSFNKDLLKQQENSCISTSTTTITTTTITTTTITISNTSNHSENEQAYMNSRLTISNASLNDVDNQQLQMDNSVDRVVSTTSGCKSSGSNVKKNGWFRNSLGKAFRKKTTSSSTLSIHSQSDLDCPTSSIQHNSIYHSNNTNTNNSLPPGHPSNLPQSPTMDHKGLHNTTTTINQSHVNSIQSINHMNVLPILSNTHLNGLSPSNSSTLSSSSSSWSTLRIGGNGQNNCNIITATTTTTSSNSSTIIPQTNEQTERLNNARQQQQQQQHQQDHRPIHSNQLSYPNHLINYNKSDKQNTSFNVEERDKNMLDNNDSKLELTKQSCQDELNHLKCRLAEKESKLTDVQLEALASAHQLDQLKDEMSHLYSQLNYLRTDNERLQILVKHLQKQQQYHHHQQQQHQQQHNTINSSISSRLLLMNNDNVMTSTNTTMTLTPTNTNVHCNSLTQTLPSISLQHKSTGLHNDDNNDMSMVCNTEIVPVECVTCSDYYQ